MNQYLKAIYVNTHIQKEKRCHQVILRLESVIVILLNENFDAKKKVNSDS